MADIELVIKISEDSYKATCKGYMLPLDVENVVQGIKNGIPLPKGHGDIVDIETLIDMFWDGDSMEITKYDLSVIEPIIEADKAVKDGENNV